MRFLSALFLMLVAGRSVLEPVRRTETEHGVKVRERRSLYEMEGDKDPRHKEKFIMHLTGPLYFNPTCKKQFNRLYHSTRDCTMPAYYRRCALLLIRLANTPRCAERCAVGHSHRRPGRCDSKDTVAS